MSRPLKALWTALRPLRTAGPMAPEIPLDRQRSADFVHDQLVSEAIEELPARTRQPSHA